jgi:hypothetical protein
VPKWKKLPALTKWERHIRLEAMNPAIRADYAQLREVIRKNQTTWAGLSPSKQVDAARELLSRNPPLLYKVTANHTWIAYQLRQELLEYIDPCATCRVVHCSTNQYDMQKEPQAIGENWGDVDDPCQCAEASLSSQLLTADQQRGVSSVSAPERRLFYSLYATSHMTRFSAHTKQSQLLPLCPLLDELVYPGACLSQCRCA